MTRFTVNQPFEVPGVVLQPNTRYVIRLLDSPSNRNIVQIYNDDQTRLITTFMAVSAERPEPADRTTFTFIETEPGYPLPIKEWFYPGRLHGLEFIYPKEQALEIARHAREPVLAASSNDLHDLASITVEATSLSSKPQPVTESAATVAKSETPVAAEERPGVPENAPAEPAVTQEQPTEQPGIENVQIAQNTDNTSIQAPQQQPQPETSSAQEGPQELPRTAGELPLIAFAGVLCFGAGLGLKVLRAKAR